MVLAISAVTFARDRKFPVRSPPGCFLVPAGEAWEVWVTIRSFPNSWSSISSSVELVVDLSERIKEESDRKKKRHGEPTKNRELLSEKPTCIRSPTAPCAVVFQAQRGRYVKGPMASNGCRFQQTRCL